MCLELALEGERLCKSGDCRAGVAFFQVSHVTNSTCCMFNSYEYILRLPYKLEQMT